MPPLPVHLRYAISAGDLYFHLFSVLKQYPFIFTGLIQSVIQDIVNILANHLISFNVSSKSHYARIRDAFAAEYSMNEFKNNRDLVILDLFLLL